MHPLVCDSIRRITVATAIVGVVVGYGIPGVHAQLGTKGPVLQPVDPYENALEPGGQRRKINPATPPVAVDPFEASSGKLSNGSSVTVPGPLLGINPSPLEQRSELRSECPSTDDMPFDYRRSWAFYLLTQDAKSCSRAVQELRTLSQAFRNGTGNADADSALGDPTFLSDAQNVYARGIVERYVNACSYSLADARAITHLTTPENIQKVRRAIGVIRVGARKCTATVVSGALLTARHCFGSASMDSTLPETVANVEFTSLDATVKFRLTTNLKEALLPPEAREDDWIALRLSGQTSDNILSLNFAPQLAQRWQPLILISVSGYAQALANESAVTPEVVRIDISPKCVVQAREGRFIYHSCQTLRGMSGAPLLSMSGADLVVVGVHTGASSGIGTACSVKLSDKYLNYGVVPNTMLSDTK